MFFNSVKISLFQLSLFLGVNRRLRYDLQRMPVWNEIMSDLKEKFNNDLNHSRLNLSRPQLLSQFGGPSQVNTYFRNGRTGGGLGAHTPDFGRSINSISTSGGRLCPPHYYSPLPFLDIQTFHHPCILKSLTSEATHSATPFFKRSFKISHPPGL